MSTGRGSNQEPLGPKSDALTTAPLRQKEITILYLTTLLTSPIEFSLYFQHYVRYLNENFREVRKPGDPGLTSKHYASKPFYKVSQAFEYSDPHL